MNFLVHSFMYSYFALRAMQYKIPKAIPKLITSLQILQMILGLIVMLVIVNFKLNNSQPQCVNNTAQIILGFITYTAFLLLFINFYVKSYLRSTKKINYCDQNNNKKFI
jgi:elongation of very long chain fatty acids protein 6